MAAEAFKGRSATDDLTAFLAQVTLYLSAIGFFIQVALTSRIHRDLGVGFALLVLPTSLGVTGLVMLLNGALWAPALARVLDTSLRYTLDKTTREVLFLPLPTALKYRAKPFVDVTVDRFAKGLGRAAGPRADQALGPRARLAADQLREPGLIGAVGGAPPSAPGASTW